MTLNVTRSQISRATRIAINIIEKIRIVSAESFSRHEPKKSKIGCVLTCKFPKNVYLCNKKCFLGIFWVLFSEKIKKKLLGYHFLEKSYCEYNHRTIFEKSKIFRNDLKKNRKMRNKKRKLFSHCIDYWLYTMKIKKI